jgi:hypothetical protein
LHCRVDAELDTRWQALKGDLDAALASREQAVSELEAERERNSDEAEAAREELTGVLQELEAARSEALEKAAEISSLEARVRLQETGAGEVSAHPAAALRRACPGELKYSGVPQGGSGASGSGDGCGETGIESSEAEMLPLAGSGSGSGGSSDGWAKPGLDSSTGNELGEAVHEEVSRERVNLTRLRCTFRAK